MKKLIAIVALCIGVGQGWAAYFDITIADNAAGVNFTGTAPSRPTGEDNETEPGTINNQLWDMESFAVSGSVGSRVLHMFGGYNFTAATGAGSYGGTIGGDIFIKKGGASPNFQPTGSSPSEVKNGVTQTGYNPAYNYTYAIDMSTFDGTKVKVYTLNADTWLETVQNDSFDANPWRVSETKTLNVAATVWTPMSFVTHTGAAFVPGYVSSDPTLYADSTSLNHYEAIIDLSWLAIAPGTDAWFSYTMQCGNDSLKGNTSGGFRTPDGGVTLLLLGLGMSALAMIRRKSS